MTAATEVAVVRKAGRKSKLTESQWIEAEARKARGEPATRLAFEYGIHVSKLREGISKRIRMRKLQQEQGRGADSPYGRAAISKLPTSQPEGVSKRSGGSSAMRQTLRSLMAKSAAQLKTSAALMAYFGPVDAASPPASSELQLVERVGAPTDDEQAPVFDARAMALMRIGGVLDAMQRAGLTAPRLVLLADRLAAGYEVASDLALLDALPAADLRTANLTPSAFIIASAAPLRPAVDALRLSRGGLVAVVIPPEVVDAGRRVASVLVERLQTPPSPAVLALIGDAIERGHVDGDELAIVRALPAVYLRSTASQRQWGVFAAYRDD